MKILIIILACLLSISLLKAEMITEWESISPNQKALFKAITENKSLSVIKKLVKQTDKIDFVIYDSAYQKTLGAYSYLSPLGLAAFKGDLKLVKLLLKAGASPTYQVDKNIYFGGIAYTSISPIEATSLSPFHGSNNLKIGKLLIKKINEITNSYQNKISSNAKNLKFYFGKLQGPPQFYLERQFSQATYNAYMHGHLNLMSFLIESGVNPNLHTRKTRISQSLLFETVSANDLATTKYLFKHGADVTQGDSLYYDYSVLSAAVSASISTNKTEMLRLVVRHIPNFENIIFYLEKPLAISIYHTNQEITSTLLSYVPFSKRCHLLTKPDDLGISLIFKTANQKNLEMLRYLLEKVLAGYNLESVINSLINYAYNKPKIVDYLSQLQKQFQKNKEKSRIDCLRGY